MIECFENFKSDKSISIFDVDDTLVVSKSKIRVHNPKTGYWASLTPQEFNTFSHRHGDKLDFSDFSDIEKLKAGKIIEWVFNILKRTLSKGKPVGIITARGDSKLIYDFLIHHDVKINKELIFAVNDPVHKYKGTTAQKKKQAFMDLINIGFRDFRFFDDDRENIKLAKELEKEHPEVNMHTVLIKQKWIPTYND